MAVLQTTYNSSQPRELFEFTNGIDVDSRLAKFEVQVQKAWAKALGRHGYLQSNEVEQVCGCLSEALDQIESGSFPWSIEDEDIHMNLERFVTQRCGALGKKMHVGRSRNDLIATTLRLYVASHHDKLQNLVHDLIGDLAFFSKQNIDVIAPGMTHCQHGQPIRFGQIMAAHGWALLRDLKRLQASKAAALSAMPLGSSAFSGTTLQIDLYAVARELGFSSPTYNSYDSVGDRDFMIEALDAYSSVASHLRRFAQDVIYWSSTAVGLLKLPMQWSTGSSIMPNKRNPDVLELTRAKCAKIIAAANNSHALVSSLPSSYSSDLHELKSVYNGSFDHLQSTIRVVTSFVGGLKVNTARATTLLDQGQVLATSLANQMIGQGVAWRDAYQDVAKLVALAERKGLQIHQLSQEDISMGAELHSKVNVEDLNFEAAVEASQCVGGSSKDRVIESVTKLQSLAHQIVAETTKLGAPKTTGRCWELDDWL